MTNRNDRGSSEDRRRRRDWIFAVYAADTMCRWRFNYLVSCEPDHPGAMRAVRCFRCGDLLNDELLTIDRIIPGCKGGTYRRNNIRPACANCNNEIAKGLSKREPSVRNAS